MAKYVCAKNSDLAVVETYDYDYMTEAGEPKALIRRFLQKSAFDAFFVLKINILIRELHISVQIPEGLGCQ